MCEEEKLEPDVEPKKKTRQWKQDNDIMQNFSQHFISPLQQLKEGLIEERKKLMKQRNEWKRDNLDG